MRKFQVYRDAFLQYTPGYPSIVVQRRPQTECPDHLMGRTEVLRFQKHYACLS